MEQVRSYHVLIRAKHDSTILEAPMWFPSPEEAEEFGKEAIRVLSWFIELDAWKITSTDQAPTHTFHEGNLLVLQKGVQ